MKLFAAALLALVCSIGAAQTSYSTNFPASENPVSQGGDWVNGKTNGTAWNNVQTLAGVAMGTQPGTGIYDDSIAALTGTWAEAQSASVTVAVPSTLGAQYDEVEAHIHVTISANSATGYEGYCPVDRAVELGRSDCRSRDGMDRRRTRPIRTTATPF